ncbi:MAG TPA: adenylate/guanylate cyclase domain-containing protein [Saprospiraceae bacterium]|nr:adenylate/guanylate cyclase domain-containing protein [Saprospiraceae bacterium]
MWLPLKKITVKVASIGSDPTDDDDIRLRKSLLLLCSFPFMVAGCAWGSLYIATGEPLSGLIPLAYAFVSMLSVIHFGITRRYQFFCFSQLLLILLLPFFLMLTLGGFINGSGVVLWSLISPLGALLFDKPSHAPRWFFGFLGLVILSGFLEPYLRHTTNLSAAMIVIFFVINFMGVGSLIFIMVFYFVNQKMLFQEKSESLLLNILPKEIVASLKKEQRTIADHFSGATILFADVVNFTPMSETMTPTELVELLDEVFSHFDLLAEKYGLEKIKTIGDCYMMASGVPRPRRDHAQALVAMALDMREYVEKQEFNGQKITFRIGLNSGPVVAGVIGRKKFIYDLWGNAVNIASRMESQGQGGVIQITRATYELIKDDFICESRGTVTVKGKGDMEVWNVVGKKTHLS